MFCEMEQELWVPGELGRTAVSLVATKNLMKGKMTFLWILVSLSCNPNNYGVAGEEDEEKVLLQLHTEFVTCKGSKRFLWHIGRSLQDFNFCVNYQGSHFTRLSCLSLSNAPKQYVKSKLQGFKATANSRDKEPARVWFSSHSLCITFTNLGISVLFICCFSFF